MLLRLLKRRSIRKPDGFFEVCLDGTKGIGHKERGPPTAPSERLDDASLRLRYNSQQSFVTRVVIFTTQDLLIAFGSFGMALFALNLYKLTKPANGRSDRTFENAEPAPLIGLNMA